MEKEIDERHQAVDLGLSVRWAACNVGAVRPEDFGDCFAWGEVAPKPEYTWNCYSMCRYDEKKNVKTLLKYNSLPGKGSVDNLTQLEVEDDAAASIWGGEWRMPTVAQFRELLDKCRWERKQQNGVWGYRVTALKPGYTDRSIFFPAAGYREQHASGENSFGAYWSKSLVPEYPIGAYCLYFNFYHLDTPGVTDYYRSCGHPVRPVCD